MKLISVLIQSNIFISLAAVVLTIETQIQLGLQPELHPYLFIIFFATIFEYNLHRLITVIKNPQALEDDKHAWVKKNTTLFYMLVVASVIGFIVSVALAKKEVLITLLPIGILTLLYSIPFLKLKNMFFRLREIPLVKIFVIAVVWSGATILLPVIHSDSEVKSTHLLSMLVERFLFVFAITIPFDIRDMETDRESGIKTIPLLLGEKKSEKIALSALGLFVVLCYINYSTPKFLFLLPAFLISALSTYYFIKSKKIQVSRYYHYFILDGTLILQGLLVLFFYYLAGTA